MLDTDTTIQELAKLLHEKPSNFYVRISHAKYYYMAYSHSLPWNWMCKIGMTDRATGKSFAVRLSNTGPLRPLEVKKRLGNYGMQVLNSYTQYLVNQLSPSGKLLNSKAKDPLNRDSKADY